MVSEEEECPICLDRLFDSQGQQDAVGVANPCGHVFHLACFEDYANNKKKSSRYREILCPTCQTAVGPKAMIPLFVTPVVVADTTALEKERDALKAQLVATVARNVDLESEKTDLETKLKDSMAELVALQSTQAKEKTDWQNQLEERAKTASDATQLATSHAQRLAKAFSTIEQLKVKIDSVETDAKAQRETLQARLDESRAEQEVLHKQVQALQATNHKMAADYKAQLQDCRTDRDQLQAKLEATIAQLDESQDKSEAQLDDLQAKLQGIVAQLEDMMDSRDEMVGKQYAAQLFATEQECDVQAEMKRLVTERDKLLEEQRDLIESLGQQGLELDDALEKIQQLEEQLKQSQDACATQGDKYNGLKIRKAALQLQYDQQCDENKTLQTRLNLWHSYRSRYDPDYNQPNKDQRVGDVVIMETTIATTDNNDTKRPRSEDEKDDGEPTEKKLKSSTQSAEQKQIDSAAHQHHSGDDGQRNESTDASSLNTLVCAKCNKAKSCADFHRKQWRKGDKGNPAECKDCKPLNTRVCAKCNNPKCQAEFSINQWKKSDPEECKICNTRVGAKCNKAKPPTDFSQNQRT